LTAAGTAVVRHFLEIDDLDTDELTAVLDLAERAGTEQVLIGQGVALLFEKPSLRTRSAAEMAVVQLGGHPLSLRGEEVGADEREPAADVARTLSTHHAVIGARVFDHARLERMADAATVPVVNLLSDLAHPCQALADLLTLRQAWDGFASGRTLAFVGDANNVCRSVTLACAMVEVRIRVASPSGYALPDDHLDRVRGLGGMVEVTDNPGQAVAGADAVYTDVWASMGQEEEAAQRRRAFQGFTVDEDLMGLAASDAVFLHCLPAHRGEEVTAGVAEGPRSLVWRQAENRMHTMRALLLFLLGLAPQPGR
jgi:ornithine carbamoyltransferase